MHLAGLMGMPRRVFTYPCGLGWEWPNLISSTASLLIATGLPDLRLGCPAAEGVAAADPAQPWGGGTLEWCHDVPERELGRPLDPLHHQALSAVGPAEAARAAGCGTLLPARRGRPTARDAGHLGHRRPAAAYPAGDRPQLDADHRRCLHRRLLHLPDLPRLLAGGGLRGTRGRRRSCGGCGATPPARPRSTSAMRARPAACRPMPRDRIRSAGGRSGSPCWATRRPSPRWSSLLLLLDRQRRFPPAGCARRRRRAGSRYRPPPMARPGR